MELTFGINDYDDECIKIYFDGKYIILLKDLKEYDGIIKQLQDMRSEIWELVYGDEDTGFVRLKPL